MKLTQIIERLYHAEYETKQELAKTFLRFQEYYESAEFKGNIFTVEEFAEWYMRTSPTAIKEKRFTYYDEWDGFNIPSKMLDPFYEGKFDPLTPGELSFLKEFAPLDEKDAYIIGTAKTTPKETYVHEVAHGLFYLDEDYRENVIRIICSMDPALQEKIDKYLSDQAAYSKDVFLDETHAYLVALSDLRDDAKIPIAQLMTPHSALLTNLMKHIDPSKIVLV